MEKISIKYEREATLDWQAFQTLLVNSTLGERRPINDPIRLKEMCENASLMVTARHEGRLVGVARSITDWVYCIYLSDLAVDAAYQKQGIGKNLIKRTKEFAPHATLILLAAPQAVHYYPKIGMKRHPDCFINKDISELL